MLYLHCICFIFATCFRLPARRSLWTSVTSGSTPAAAAGMAGPQAAPALHSSLQNNLSLPQNAFQVRTNARKYYKPNAYKRMRKHGYKKRISTKNGLAILWRRYLKGRHELWHWLLQTILWLLYGDMFSLWIKLLHVHINGALFSVLMW